MSRPPPSAQRPQNSEDRAVFPPTVFAETRSTRDTRGWKIRVGGRGGRDAKHRTLLRGRMNIFQ